MIFAPGTKAISSTPLADSYRRLGEISELLDIRVGAPPVGETWVTGRQLARDPAVLDRAVAEEERRIRDAYAVAPRRDVAATWVLHRYAFTACLAMSGPWYLDRRVPRVTPEGVGYQWTDRALTVRPDSLTCLPGDPAEGLAGVRTVPDEEALRAELRAAVADHLAPLLEAFRPLLRRGPRALWGMASDELTEGLWHLGRLLGDPEAAAQQAQALLPGSTAPYVGGAGFRPPTHGCAESTRTRIGCRLYYTIRPSDLCTTCPRTP
jgi:hypothetical protein